MVCIEKLNSDRLRMLNVIACIAKLVLVYGGMFGWYGKDYREVSQDNIALFNPADRSYQIWSVIYVMEVLFVGMQLSRRIVPSVWVSHVVSIWYACLCVMQPLWSVCFAREWMIPAQVFIMASWMCLGAIARNWVTFRMNVYKGSQHNPLPNFLVRLLCVAPFTLQFGWMTAAMFANLNNTVSYYAFKGEGGVAGKEWRLIMAPVISLGFLMFFAMYHSLTQRAITAVPLALCWATANIGDQLRTENLSPRLQAMIDSQTIYALERSFMFASWLCAALFVISAAKDALWFFKWGKERLMEIGLLQKLKPGEMIGLKAMMAPCANCEHMSTPADLISKLNGNMGEHNQSEMFEQSVQI